MEFELDISDEVAHRVVPLLANHPDLRDVMQATLTEIATLADPPGAELPGTDGMRRIDRDGLRVWFRPSTHGAAARIEAVVRTPRAEHRRSGLIRLGDRPALYVPQQPHLVATSECRDGARVLGFAEQRAWNDRVAALRDLLELGVDLRWSFRGIRRVDRNDTVVAGWPAVCYKVTGPFGSEWTARVIELTRVQVSLLVDLRDGSDSRPDALPWLDDLERRCTTSLLAAPGAGPTALS